MYLTFNSHYLWVKLWISERWWSFPSPDLCCHIFFLMMLTCGSYFCFSWYDCHYFYILKNQPMFRVGMVSLTKSLMDIFCQDLKSLFHQVLQIPSILFKVEVAPQFQNQEMQFMTLTKRNTILFFLIQFKRSWISVCIWSNLSHLCSSAGTVNQL